MPTPRIELAPPVAVAAPSNQSQPVEKLAKAAEGETQGDDALYFDLDAALLQDDARPLLQKVATRVKSDHRLSVRIEGNCDQSGTAEYNLALGENRARSAKKYLEALGVPAKRISIVSYGKERPKYPGTDEASLAKNRRDDVLIR